MQLLRDFLRLESAGGILLVISAIMALLVENSSLSYLYDSLLTTKVMLSIGTFEINKPLLLWINDGLMALFFLLVGLELKREVLIGKLKSKSQMILPAIAACGGLLTPALIYTLINWGDAHALRGWAIPAATDIAFALGMLTLLNDKIPQSLKVCLIAIAILDDIAAILIIAIFYTKQLSVLSMLFAFIGVMILALLNYKKVYNLSPYIVTGIYLWACVLKSGVHATLAGVILAFFIPLMPHEEDIKSPLKRLEHNLHPWVAFAILPLFAFANAGVPLSGISLDFLLEPITLGIALGLFIGGQVGVTTFTFIGSTLHLCKIPKDISWLQFYGMALLTGIGFTMSLFIGGLAFNDVTHQNAVRLGVIMGSLASGLCGFLVLWFTSQKKSAT